LEEALISMILATDMGRSSGARDTPRRPTMGAAA